MKIFSWNDILSYLETGVQDTFFKDGTGISIGSFDGLHKGHKSLLNTLITECKDLSLLSGVITFSRPLPSIKHPNDYQGDICSLEQRKKILEDMGIDFLILIDFNDAFASILGSDFLNILVNACNMEFLAEGIDFRCGYKGSTDAQAIKYFAEQHDLKTVFVDRVYYCQTPDRVERISSSFIRSMIIKGYFSTVEKLLERPYILDLQQEKITQVLPKDGVYHCKNELNQDVRVEIIDKNVKPDRKSKYLIFSV